MAGTVIDYYGSNCFDESDLYVVLNLFSQSLHVMVISMKLLALLFVALSKTDGAVGRKVNHGEQESTRVQRKNTRRNSEWSMTFRSKSSVSNLGSLEGNNHVGGRTKHGQVTSDRGRERNLEPLVR